MSEESTTSASERRTLDAAEQRRAVRNRYARIATSTNGETDCCTDSESCCDGESPDSGSQKLGYDDTDLHSVAEGADLGLGCGNPNAIASLDEGETVLNLGSGAGFDCFLAAKEVGDSGRVIGVDMTPEMVEKARENIVKNDATNVEFRLGEIEHLPVSDETVDVIISNCVINLSPNKPQVFGEAFRALRPGGRLAVSDVVMTAPIPKNVQRDPESMAACIGGASTIDDLRAMLSEAGFVDVEIKPKEESGEFIREWDDSIDLNDYIVSAAISGEKPVEGR
ncbi:arsenite S-adenosylmethyltransferase [Haloprofundus marisrubri]|uniref:Arsenite methyltransferase n=1 Tax=Haloprofundus marisrubri TaxID=1514971 RepID=A0A0W1R398_9EURY|nr:arsenite methyltransferase [Haloprofundus marisrubri]KTG07691.1 arsenite S-adenosylmethyltransferase [Haloprofundus marisrubri]